jgi:hypothetical protein
MRRFPKDFSTEIGGMSFSEIFETLPKWTSCVYETWTDHCTGIFDEFRKYILLRMSEPNSKSEHEKRCYKFVKQLKEENVPTYMLKYAGEHSACLPRR